VAEKNPFSSEGRKKKKKGGISDKKGRTLERKKEENAN